MRRIVLTGGPGAGKSAVLELVRATTCPHVLVLPEAASVVFGGGFPREPGFGQRRAAQRAIFHVQHELEALAEAGGARVVLCDRGTPDGLAYWPGDPGDLWADVHSTLAQEVSRYDAVIHLLPPADGAGYDHANPLRTESAEAAAQIDVRIAAVWSSHPHVTTIPATGDFLAKAHAAVRVILSLLPPCPECIAAGPVPSRAIA